MHLGEGEEFAGFTVVRRLGGGGMGEVYLAQHPRLPRLDALKVLNPEISADDDYRVRFLREAEMAAGLGHPHIVSVHDRGETEDGTLWVSMEYVEGIDAGAYLARHYPDGMPLWMVTEITLAIGAALDYAHGQRLLHRDVKPANILLGDLGEGQYRVVLTDFGIARVEGEEHRLTEANMTVGTVNHTSPEQLTADHLLTGKPLFADSNAAVVIGSHLSVEPPPVSEQRPELAELDEVVARGLAKDRDARYPNCTAFARALSGLPEQSGEFTVGRAVVTASGPIPRTTGTQGRHRADADEDDDGYWETAGSQPTMLAPAAQGTSNKRLLWAMLVGVPLIVIATVLLVLALLPEGLGTGRYRGEATSTAAPTEARTPVPSTAAQAPVPPAAPTTASGRHPWTGVVAVECGGTEPCELQQRNAPYTSAPRLHPEGLHNGTVVSLACHVVGDERSNPGDGSSRLWYRLSNGAYVNSVYLDNVIATGMQPC